MNEKQSFREQFNEVVGESVKRHGWLKISEPEMVLMLLDQAILWHVGGYARLDDEIIDHQNRLWWEWVHSLSSGERYMLLHALQSEGVRLPSHPGEVVVA